MLNRESILFIGGGGFIGSNLVRRFVNGGEYQVLVFETEEASLDRINDVLDRIKVFRGRLEDISYIESLVDRYQIKYIVHLVSGLLPNSGIEEYQNEITNIIKPTIEVIHLCSLRKVTFIYFSSGGTVYGSTDDALHKETDAVAPISYYGLSKCNIENEVLTEHRHNNLSYLILRPSNPYGHGQRLFAKQGLIAVAIGKVLKGEPLEIYGDGRNVRDYIYIDDLAEYVYLLVSKRIHNEIFNIGSGKGYTNHEVLSLLAEVCQRDLNIMNKEMRSGDVKSFILDVEKLSRYVPIQTKSLMDGISEFWKESIKQN